MNLFQFPELITLSLQMLHLNTIDPQVHTVILFLALKSQPNTAPLGEALSGASPAVRGLWPQLLSQPCSLNATYQCFVMFFIYLPS